MHGAERLGVRHRVADADPQRALPDLDDLPHRAGMTRRLEPMERIHELSSASVPFSFNVHAMLFTTDAPALERRLHAALEPYRVNRINPRKEFFRVPPDLLKATVLREFPDVVFLDRPEAEEYYRSMRDEEAATLVDGQWQPFGDEDDDLPDGL